MAIKATVKQNTFGVGDVIKVHQTVMDSKGGEDKKRTQVFEGTVIGIKGHGNGQSFTVRRVGSQNIGIEQIYPVNTPTIEKIEVIREGLRGSRQSKLYYIRNQSKREIEKIYTRAKRRTEAKKVVKKVEKADKPKKQVKKTKKAVKVTKTSKK